VEAEHGLLAICLDFLYRKPDRNAPQKNNNLHVWAERHPHGNDYAYLIISDRTSVAGTFPGKYYILLYDPAIDKI